MVQRYILRNEDLFSSQTLDYHTRSRLHENKLWRKYTSLENMDTREGGYDNFRVLFNLRSLISIFANLTNTTIPNN